MRRREFIALIASASVACPLAALAQQAGRTYRLGCLLPLPRDTPVNTAFFDELRRRGFIEGQNLTVEYRAYGLNVDLISQYAVELVKAQVDVIITCGDPTPTFGHDVGGRALGIGLGYSHALYARLWDRMRQQRLLRRLRRLREQRTSACCAAASAVPSEGVQPNESLPPAPDA